jgi:MGT family glycosyltransferase
MRTIIAIMPASGHFNPIVPLARALEAAGHEVVVGCAASFLPAAEAVGLRGFSMGRDLQQMMAEHSTSGPPPMAAEGARTLRLPRISGTFFKETLPDILSFCQDWRPDLIIHGPFVMAAAVAADLAGIPHVVYGNGLIPPPEFREQVSRNINEARRAHGLADAPDDWFHHLYLSFAPPSFQRPCDSPNLRFIRPEIEDRTGPETLPGWVARLPKDRPTLYVTLGTIFNEAPGVFETILEGLRDEPLNVIVTVGRSQDPARFGPQPEHIRIERYIPMSELLPHCDAVLTHGGFNTLMTALSHAMPVLVVPLGADQPFNAQRCAEVGVGEALPAADLTPEQVREAVRALLARPGYRAQAARLRDEIAALPGPAEIVPILEELAART